MAGHYKPKKGFNYEDDHDYDDAVDYAKEEMVYWYGKYYKKEKIDQMYETQGGGSGSGLISMPLLGVIVGGALLWGVCEVGNNVLTNHLAEKRQRKRKKENEQKKQAKNL